ncbi:MAG: primosomal protein N', partial [Gemmatimonadota bacterium]|nr:primosomal protein N' [Gemmatimonadota bacterium]
VEVSLPPPVARELTYGVPAEFAAEAQSGALVLVPVVQRRLTGIVLGPATLGDLPPCKIRPIEQILDTSLLSPELVALCRWMASYYMAPLGSALMAALPPGVKLSSNRLVQLREAPIGHHAGIEARIIGELQRSGSLKVSTLKRRLGSRGLEQGVRALRRRGHIEVAPVLEDRRPRTLSQRCFLLNDKPAAHAAIAAIEKRAPRQAACLRYLLDHPMAARSELSEAGFSSAVLKALEGRGLISPTTEEVIRDPLAHIASGTPLDLVPTADQQQVLNNLSAALDAQKFYPALLHGVTGSGKTLVYVQLVTQALAAGRGAIILVPEIALAWQMVRRFKEHFGEAVAVFHSQLSAGERYDTWRRLRRREQRVLIGARSAILAPVENLGLIVVDEEHDTSYKQEDLDSSRPLTYNARDLALVRGQRSNAVVVLGSATPSLESHWNAATGKYHLHTLPRRIDDRPLPQVTVVDMKQEPFQRKQRAIFSHDLRRKMQDRLARGEKIILLQNRRGFAPFISCTNCGEPIQCPSCRVSLTYHRRPSASETRCHYCDFTAPLPPVCPSCGSSELRFAGVGTQKVESALLAQFPGIRVIRMDVDTTAWKGAHDALVERFRNGEADVLLGTQMVAKGLDLPEVTLVGVISADTGMHLPDFRAAERSFQLLTQVAGRSGRGHTAGEVVIQTLLPDDAALRAAANQNYAAFAHNELAQRQQAGFPPFGRLIVFRWRGPCEQAVETGAQQGVNALRQGLDQDALVLGPAPAPLARLRGNYRWQALLRGSSARHLRATALSALPAMREAAKDHALHFSINIDPLTMM